VIQVRKGEGRLVIALGILNFLVILAFTLARVARDGFLLSHLQARKLPYVSVGLALFMLLVSASAGWLTRRASAGRGLARISLITGLSLLGFSLWFRVGGAGAAVAFYLWTGAYGLLLISQFWNLANEQIDPRQAKRLFGLIGAGGIVGGLAAGASASLAAHLLAPADLLVAIALLHVLAAIAGLRFTPPSPDGRRTAAAAADESLKCCFERPYVRLLALVTLVGGVTAGVLDYQFKISLQQRFPAGQALTAFLGLFYAAQNVLALLAQLGLSRMLFARLGASRVAASLPGGVLAGSAVTALLPVFPVVVGTRLYDASMRASVARTADELSLFPLLDATRRPLKRFLDGPVTRIADAVAGLLVLAVNGAVGGTLVQHAILCAVLALSWLLLRRRLDGYYAAEISTSLDRTLVGQRPTIASLEEARAALELVSLLDDPNERHVVYAMDRLAGVAPEVLRERQARLLGHPSEVVRRRAATTLSLLGVALAPREAASSPGQAPTTIADVEASRRRLAVRVDDPDPSVRHAAYQSLALSGQRESVALLVGRLARLEDRRFAREALASYGPRILGALGDYLVDPGTPLRVRREIPRLLAGLGTQDAANALLRGAVDVADAMLAQRTLWALDRIRKRDPTVTLPVAAVERHLSDETNRYLRLLVLRTAASLGLQDRGSRLLLRVLEERSRQCQERLFRRLGLLYPTSEILRARRGVMNPSPRVRAQALEYLEAVLSPGHRALLEPLLADIPNPERARLAAARLGEPFPSWQELLRDLSDSKDGWLRACALFAIGSLRARELASCVDAALASPDRRSRSVAAWVHTQLAAG
jgi:HEAT repeat protein